MLDFEMEKGGRGCSKRNGGNGDPVQRSFAMRKLYPFYGGSLGAESARDGITKLGHCR